MDRRRFLQAFGLAAAGVALAPALPARAAFADATYARFIAARAVSPWLAGWETLDLDALPRRAARMEGRLPAALRGTLFRNGPGRFDRAGFRYRHWFDGDGLLQAWRLGDAGITHEARFVATAKYQRESAAGRFLVNGAGSVVPDAQPIRNADDLNAANTAVLPIGGALFALWEGGSPWVIDPETLASRGPHTFRDDLAATPFSAHPLIEPDGSVWNLGLISYASDPLLLLWQLDARGALVRATPIPTGSAGYLHSFAMTQRHLVAVLAPLELEDMGASYFESLRWRPERKSVVLVIDKHDPSRVTRHELPAGMVYHWADAHERDGWIQMHGCWYDDAPAVDASFAAVMRGEPLDAQVRSELVRVRLPLGSGSASLTREGLPDLEFPDFDRRSAEVRRHLYGLAQHGRSAANYLNAVVAIDRRRDRVQRFAYGEQVLAEEHRFVPRPGATRENDGWLLGTALDAARGEHMLCVFDAARVEDGPLCTARIAQAMPLSFHAAFSPQA